MIHFAHFMISYQMAFKKVFLLAQNSHVDSILFFQMTLNRFPVPVLVDYYTW